MWLKFGILSALGLNMKNWKNTQVTIVTDIVAKGLVQLPSNIRDWHQSRLRNISHCTRFQPLYETSNTIFVTGHWRILSITHTLIWIRLTLEDELVGIKSESQWSDYGEVFFFGDSRKSGIWKRIQFLYWTYSFTVKCFFKIQQIVHL